VLEKRGEFPEHEEGLLIAGTLMALMLERARG
jgi:hypothetical protein